MSPDQLIREAIMEDIGDGDHTSMAIIPEEARGKACLLLKANGVLAGVDIAKKVFHTIDENLDFKAFVNDGEVVQAGDIGFAIEGKSRSILMGERTALNFLQRMSGIATFTRRVINELDGLKAKVLDTRKTTPLLRLLEKEAVRLGGGTNHRMGLYDMVMIKDNHIDFAGGIQPAIDAVKKYLKITGKNLRIEIEIRNFAELEEVLKIGGVNRIMLDNFTPADLREAVKIIDKRFETEASGGINIDNIRVYAETGVDFISMGALTHQIKSIDMSLKAF